MTIREAITFPTCRGDFIPRGKMIDFRAYWGLASRPVSRPFPTEPRPVAITFRITVETLAALVAEAAP